MPPTDFPEDDELEAIEFGDDDILGEDDELLADIRPPDPLTSGHILQWQREMGVVTHGTMYGTNRRSSPTPTESSSSTVRDCHDDFDCTGFWLAGNPSEQRRDYEQ